MRLRGAFTFRGTKQRNTAKDYTRSSMSERLLTVDEFATRTHQHAETVRRQIRRGDVPTVRTGRKYLIPESVVTVSATAPEAVITSFSHLPEVPSLDLAALFAPPSPEEIARRLEALKAFDCDEAPDEKEADEVDLSGDRGDVYGYMERENRHL